MEYENICTATKNRGDGNCRGDTGGENTVVGQRQCYRHALELPLTGGRIRASVRHLWAAQMPNADPLQKRRPNTIPI